MSLSEVEDKYGFKYPVLYKVLEKDGMLAIGDYGPNWYKDVFPVLKENPTLLLYSKDFELLGVDSMPEAINSLSIGDYGKINSELKLIPFAKSGAGDFYCFYLNEQKAEDVPVVMFWHDADRVDYLAKNLQDYIFKALLTYMAEQDIYNQVSDEDFRNAIKYSLKTHSRYLTSEQLEVLQGLASREIFDYEVAFLNVQESRRGLLTEAELEVILQSVIPYEKMGSSFKYLLPEQPMKVTEENKRRLGTLIIKIRPAPAPQDKIFNKLKALNWRSRKSENTECLEFFRKNAVFFGMPSMATLDQTFKEKLIELRSLSKNLEIQFEEEGGKIYFL